MSKNQAGFGVVGIIAIVVVLGVIGFIGWRLYDNAQQEPPSATQTVSPSTSTDPYEGWKTYTLKYEKFSFKYPATFALKDTSAADEYARPGMDNISLTKQNGFTIRLQTGVHDVGGACEECRVISTQELTFLGQKASINYVDNDKTGEVANIVVTNKSDDWFGLGLNGKNVTSTPDGKALPMGIYIHYDANGDLVHKDLSETKASEDMKEALKILESASY